MSDTRIGHKQDCKVFYATAAEEAAHAGVAWALGWDVEGVAANHPAPHLQGVTRVRYKSDPNLDVFENLRQRHEDYLRIALAGKMRYPDSHNWPPKTLALAAEDTREQGLAETIAELVKPSGGGFSQADYKAAIADTRAILTRLDTRIGVLAEYLYKSEISGGIARPATVEAAFRRSPEQVRRDVHKAARKS